MATLGRIIEVLSGQKYEDFLTARVFKPLGMKDSFFFPPPQKTSRIAIAYRNRRQTDAWRRAHARRRVARYRKGATYSCPECGRYSTAADLAILYEMFLNGGTRRGVRIISRAAVDLMTTNQTPTLPKSFGLGWEVRVQHLPDDGQRSVDRVRISHDPTRVHQTPSPGRGRRGSACGAAAARSAAA